MSTVVLDSKDKIAYINKSFITFFKEFSMPVMNAESTDPHEEQTR